MADKNKLLYPAIAINDARSKYLFEKWLAVNINTDDPTMFETTLTEEFLLLYERLNFSIAEIKKLMINAAEVTFLSKDKKSKLNSTVEIFWQ